MRRLFLPILTYPVPTPGLPLQRALDLAAILGASVHCAVVEIDIPPLSNPFPIGIDVVAMAAEAEAVSRRRATELLVQVQDQARRAALALDATRYRSRLEMVGGILASSARTYDLTMLCVADDDEHRNVAETLMFQSGGPVVLVPALDARVHLDTVAVAWDGSRAAARAVHDAIPLLARAERVVVLTVESDKAIDPFSVDGVLRLLEAHEVNAIHIDVLMSASRTVGEALQSAALEKGAGLLVMGAYGHSRLREFVLGGATRSILANQLLPILMAH